MDIIVVETNGADFASLEKYLVCISGARRKALLKKASEEGRIQSLVGGLLVRSEISRRSGMPIKKIVFDRGAHGKPYVKDCSVQFSLSHTKGAVCAAFATGDEIGVDIERMDRCVSSTLNEKILSENELALVKDSADFIRIWVKKEAFLKRTGIGIASKLSGADTTLIPDIAAFECGGFFIGAAGKSAEAAKLSVLTLPQLLGRFDDML
ncbi:MAG: 4'-phosphopantetheinyl transferase family protein [Oscillospiraceae bacterium]